MKAMMKKALIAIAAATIIALFTIPAQAATEVAITKAAFPTTASVKVGEAKTLSVTTTPANATYKTQVAWSRVENGAFTTKVNGYGTFKNQAQSVTITGKKAGTGTITATVKTLNAANKVVNTYTLKCTVTITDATPLTGISLSKTAATINKGANTTLSVTYKPANTTADKTVTWTSSNTAIATVSAGKVTAKAPGTATITAKVGTKTATCKVTVKAPLTSISMSKTAATVVAGNATALSVNYNPSNTTDSKTVTWTSSNTAVATVSGGKVTAKKAGTATITAKVGTKTATCKVTVTAAPAGTYVNVDACYTTLNTYRTNAKVGKVTKNTTLENIAKTRAKELVTSFSHTRPNGQSGLTLITGNVYKGENIAMGQTSCAEVMKSWYASAGHKANMIKKNYTKVGTAGYKYNGTIYWVQVFSS